MSLFFLLFGFALVLIIRWQHAYAGQPLQVGATDMAFPRLNLLSYWLYFAGGVVILQFRSLFFVP